MLGMASKEGNNNECGSGGQGGSGGELGSTLTENGGAWRWRRSRR
jgi:hypothetical protein